MLFLFSILKYISDGVVMGDNYFVPIYLFTTINSCTYLNVGVTFVTTALIVVDIN